MKNKFIRVIQPLTLIFLTVLDLAAILLLSVAIIRLIKGINFYSLSFLFVDVVVLITAIASTVKTLSNGVKFDDNSMEFTAIDENNIYSYSDILSVESHKDSKASLKKKFTDRYSSVILHLNDGTVATIELGYTSKRTLDKIIEETEHRLNT